MLKLTAAVCAAFALSTFAGAASLHFVQRQAGFTAQPLEEITIADAPGSTVVVLDGKGRKYFRAAASTGAISFYAGGALGRQTVEALDANGRIIAELHFDLDAKSSLTENTRRFEKLFEIAKRTMESSDDNGIGTIVWRGRTYHYFDPWILDHSNTLKGMQYFNPYAAEMVDLFAASQRPDGMIYSFAFPDGPVHGYHYWAYKDQGYAKVDDGVLFGRQPVENHNESNFVDALYNCWKANGDDRWMESHLASAEKALNYSVTDRARWSPEYKLLKRGYTIDSWDFQPDDKYLVHFTMGSEQQIDPDRTKFVIFFGDNTLYAFACDELAIMLEHAGRTSEASTYRERAKEIRERLNKVAWNGSFYRHHLEIDPTVHRDLGQDENKQIAFSNMYSLNRGIGEPKIEAIIDSYKTLREHLPPGSPGEWYAVYPPYARGFGKEDDTWQYMNGGVHAHAAGELARGALEHGFENYGADILSRLSALGHANGDKLYFAYTGAFPAPPPAPVFRPVDLSSFANMGIDSKAPAGTHTWMNHTNGNDMRNLPLGSQVFDGISFRVAKPNVAGGAVGVAVSVTGGLPKTSEIPIHAQANALYLLHAAEGTAASQVAAALRFLYDDGTSATQYLLRDKQIGSTWFPHIEAPDAGIAWRGANGQCGDVGVSWTAIQNPHPAKTIRAIALYASEEGATYVLLALSLADRMPHYRAPAVSYGGPDNWSGGLVLFALTEGLAGVHDDGRLMQQVTLSPRWAVAQDLSNAAVTLRYGASDAYSAYQYAIDREQRTIRLRVAGNGQRPELRVLLPAGAKLVVQARVGGRKIEPQTEQVRTSVYAVVKTEIAPSDLLEIEYR